MEIFFQKNNQIDLRIFFTFEKYDLKDRLLYKLKMSIRSQKSIKHPDDTSPSFEDNPYELLRKLNERLTQHQKTIEEYQMAFTSVHQEKQIAYLQNHKLLKKIQDLKTQVQKQRHKRKENQIQVQDLKYKLRLRSQGRINEPIRNKFSHPFQSDFVTRFQTTKSNIFETKNITELSMAQKKEEDRSQEFIPQPIRFSLKNRKQSNSFDSQNGTNSDFNKYAYAQNFIEDFYVIGPQTNEFKHERHNHKNKEEINVPSGIFFSTNKFYKANKQQFLAEIAKRAFPLGCTFKKTLLNRPEDLNFIIEYKPESKLSEDYFIFTLKGDESLLTSRKRGMLANSNPNYFLYIVCLKIPEFIYVHDEKYYHRKESEVWKTQVTYAIATYYPFIPIIINILSKIHNILRQNCVQKVSIEGQNPLLWGYTRNTFDLQKNQEVKDILNHFMMKKPDYNQVCTISRCYFGTMPEIGFRNEYIVAMSTCPIFFSNFAYEQLLLLITAIFCQKTLVFMSESESMATFCALFLINIIYPFQYSEPLLLNCDYEKIKSMIFEFPFAMICSLKKTQKNLDQILYLFSESNVLRSIQSDAQHILIDVDTNTILYENVMTELFEQCIVSPNEKLKKAYEEINPCSSKSFSLKKILPREEIREKKKGLHNIQKKEEEKKKYVKEYHQRISNNKTKLPSFKFNENHEELVKLLISFVQSFTLQFDIGKQFAAEKNKTLRLENVKHYLLEKNRTQLKLTEYFIQSQMYANYLDSFNDEVRYR